MLKDAENCIDIDDLYQWQSLNFFITLTPVYTNLMSMLNAANIYVRK